MDPIAWAVQQMPGDAAAKLVLLQMAAEIQPPSHPALLGPPWWYDGSPYRIARLAALCSLAEEELQGALRVLDDAGLARREQLPDGDLYQLGIYHYQRWVAASVRNAAPVPAAMRRAVLERDRHRCVKCGSTEGLQIDHIYPRWLGGLNVLANLQTLCAVCNMAKGMD